MKDLELHAVFSFKTNTSNCIERVLQEVLRREGTITPQSCYWHILYTVLSSVKSDTLKFLRGVPWKGNTICLLNLEKTFLPQYNLFFFIKLLTGTTKHTQKIAVCLV